MQNFFLMSNVRDPPNLINRNLGDDQKTRISTDVRPAFFPQVLEEMSRYVNPLKWKSRLLIFIFCINIVTILYICLLIKFWRFLSFRSEPRLKQRLATSGGAMQELRFNSSPAAS